MLDVEGIELSQEEREILQHPLVGGVILFTRNYENIEQLTQLVREIKQLRQPPLLIGVDHEGGRVQRFRQGFSRIPPAALFGELYTESADKAVALCEQAAWLMAAELISVGIDFSFAPVLDIDYGQSSVIGDRAFHSDVDIIVTLAQAYTEGMADAGMASVAKHFPGHGYVEADSHIDIPIDHRELDEIYQADIQPFKRLIEKGLTAIMPAHVIYDKVDKLPAGFSSRWIQDILRTQLVFQGVIFSDDLTMQGASTVGDNYAARAQQALSAGCDIALICNNRSGAVQILDELDFKIIQALPSHWTRMYAQQAFSFQELIRSLRWQTAQNELAPYTEKSS